MKIKNLLKRLAEIGLIGASIYFAKTLYKAKQFKISCDINPDSLDEFTIGKVEVVDLPGTEMSDFKAGAFLGVLYINTVDLKFNERHYDITIEADKGIVTLVFPKDVGLEVTCPQPLSHVIDTRDVLPEDVKTLVSINADLHTGLLIIETR